MFGWSCPSLWISKVYGFWLVTVVSDTSVWKWTVLLLPAVYARDDVVSGECQAYSTAVSFYWLRPQAAADHERAVCDPLVEEQPTIQQQRHERIVEDSSWKHIGVNARSAQKETFVREYIERVGGIKAGKFAVVYENKNCLLLDFILLHIEQLCDSISWKPVLV